MITIARPESADAVEPRVYAKGGSAELALALYVIAWVVALCVTHSLAR